MKKDPDELNSVTDQALERNLVNELILQLGEHPDAITNRVENYNRNSFIEWKKEQGRAPRTFGRPGRFLEKKRETVCEALAKVKTTKKIFQAFDGKLISNETRARTCDLLKIGSLHQPVDAFLTIVTEELGY